jgi:branched-chain amino acid transport system ATP-binding protein
MLHVERLDARYGAVPALRDVSFSVAAGELTTLIGPNGAGKSTTLRTISGLLRAVAGSISFEGRRIDRLRPAEIVRLGVVHVPEGKRLFRDMTVHENLISGAYLRRDKDIKADLSRTLRYFPRLEERRRQRASRLSGGEQQMLAIARALMARPRLLMLDEPSLGLAPVIVEELGTMMRTLLDEGLAIILVEQNASLALDLADNAYLLESGSIALGGKCDEIRDHPRVRAAYLGD